MRNSQRFEGLEEDEITWHSNVVIGCQKGLAGLEEDEITWHSNQHSPQLVNRVGLAEDKLHDTQTTRTAA